MTYHRSIHPRHGGVFSNAAIMRHMLERLNELAKTGVAIDEKQPLDEGRSGRVMISPKGGIKEGVYVVEYHCNQKVNERCIDQIWQVVLFGESKVFNPTMVINSGDNILNVQMYRGGSKAVTYQTPEQTFYFNINQKGEAVEEQIDPGIIQLVQDLTAKGLIKLTEVFYFIVRP